MKVQLILGNDGSILVVVPPDGVTTFEEASHKLLAIRAILGDLPIQFVGDIEQHVSDPDLHVIYHRHEAYL